jgi:hypothetical protein
MSHDLFVSVTDVGELETSMKAALEFEGLSVASVKHSADEILPYGAFEDVPNHPVRDRG